MKDHGMVLGMVMLVCSGAMAQEVPASRLEDLRVQAEDERAKEHDLHLLQMELERLKLEIEKQKAMVELGGLSGTAAKSAGVTSGEAHVVVKYVFSSAGRQEAVVSADGVERRVKLGDELPLGVVKSITPKGVVLADKDGRERVFSLP